MDILLCGEIYHTSDDNIPLYLSPVYFIGISDGTAAFCLSAQVRLQCILYDYYARFLRAISRHAAATDKKNTHSLREAVSKLVEVT